MLHKMSFYLLLLSCLYFNVEVFCTNGVSYALTGGRFGDNIRAYGEARWIAYKNHFDFYYRPFVYSNQLAFHKLYPAVSAHNKKKALTITDVNQIMNTTQDTLFITQPYPANNNVDQDNIEFHRMLKKELSPLRMFPPIAIPEGHYSIAVHVRRGGGWDNNLCQRDALSNAKSENGRNYVACIDQRYPRKFAPDSFYIEQLDYVANLNPGKKIYVYLFTDDPKPLTIVEKYQKALSHPQIIFDYRKEHNRHDTNVLEDFYAMMQFDCLIRGQSHYSIWAGILGRIKLEIGPEHFEWQGNDLYITSSKVIERHDTPNSLHTTKKIEQSSYFLSKKK